MTQFVLKSLLRNSLLIFLIILSNRLLAQDLDTVIVYEYIYKTDTIWIEPKPVMDTIVLDQMKSIEDATLYLDTTRNTAKLVIFSSGKSATIPINNIIIGENNNHYKMRRKGFFTMLLLSVQVITFGQEKWSMNIGANSSWLIHNTKTVNNPVWAGAHIGSELNFPFKDSKFSFSVGGKINYMFPTANYRQSKQINGLLPHLEYDYATIQTKVILNELNTGLFDTSYVNISVPLKLKYRIGRWQPYIGAAYDLSCSLYKVPEDDYRYDNSTPKTIFHDLELLIGTGFNFSRKIGCSLELSYGLFGKYNSYEDPIAPTLGVSEYTFKSLNMDFSIFYNF